jgi:5-methylcytosine-specific restriction enzyme B
MPDSYVSQGSIKAAIASLRGTADAMLKVWLTLKVMGLSDGNSVVIDTKNSEQAVSRLFSYGADDYFVPFATTRSDLKMARDAPRSHIQTNIKKFRDRTVGFDPSAYLQIIQRPDEKWDVSTLPNYPLGLGYGKNGFARGDGQQVAIPIRAWAVWWGRKTPVPGGGPNSSDYLVSRMLTDLNIDAAERATIFRDDTEFVPEFGPTCVSDDDLRTLVADAVSGDRPEPAVLMSKNIFESSIPSELLVLVPSGFVKRLPPS